MDFFLIGAAVEGFLAVFLSLGTLAAMIQAVIVQPFFNLLDTLVAEFLIQF